MRLPDRIARSLFVALAVGLGIRGDFGHVLGAMFPGACLADDLVRCRQGAALPHLHAGSDMALPAGHDLRPHFHLHISPQCV
jgi:hypothetical protein